MAGKFAPSKGKVIEDKIPREFLFHRFEKNLSGAAKQTGGGRMFEFSEIIGGTRLLKVLRETASPHFEDCAIQRNPSKTRRPERVEILLFGIFHA